MRKFQISTVKKGFSLIELLVVMAILGGLAVAMSRIFFANLRGTEKTQRLLELRQAGDQAILLMKKKIRVSREVDASILNCSPGASGDTIMTVSRDPEATSFASTATITTEFSCITDDRGTPGDLTDDVDRLRMTEVQVSTGTTLVESDITPEYLTVVECSTPDSIFTCEQAVGNPAKVTVDFTLQNEDNDTMNFSSAVSLRNF